MPATITIRPAVVADLPALVEIYNYEVLHGVATFDTEPQTAETRMGWFEEHDTGEAAAAGTHPLVVAEAAAEGSEPQVVGYASLSAYRPKDAYAATVELSVYVHRDWRGQGVGRTLVAAMVDHARAHGGIHVVLSLITSGNAASERLHEAFGFERVGRTHETGRKFGQWLDDETWELRV